MNKYTQYTIILVALLVGALYFIQDIQPQSTVSFATVFEGLMQNSTFIYVVIGFVALIIFLGVFFKE